MKVKLVRDARIRHCAGEIVEVSPAEANFLLSCKSAIELPAEKKPEATEVQAEKPEETEAQAEKPKRKKK